MCGRYTLVDPDRIAGAFPRFAFESFSEYRLPRFNVAPTQMVLGVRNDGRAAVEALHWGLGGTVREPARPLFNARSESAFEKPSFRDAARARRCIVFADGFYEWHARRPVHFTMRDGAPFAFAGLWEDRTGGGNACALLTCAPNALVARIHDRMPVILTESAIDVWLSPAELSPALAAQVLQPFDAASMQARPASSRVNNARYDAPEALIDDDPEQLGLGMQL